MFGPFSRHFLKAKLRWMCDKCLHASQICHTRNLDSKCPQSTGPKDKPARHIKPGALIIQRGDGCRRQINVFYNSTPAFHCNLSWREGKRSTVVHYHALYLLKWTNSPKQMQFSKWNDRVSGENLETLLIEGLQVEFNDGFRVKIDFKMLK